MQGAGCRVQDAGCRVQGAGCRIQGADLEHGDSFTCSPLADLGLRIVGLRVEF